MMANAKWPNGTVLQLALVAVTIGAIALSPAYVLADGQNRRRELDEALIGIDASKARYTAAVKRGDAETIMELSTPDSVTVGHDGNVIKGKADIGASWNSIFALGMVEERFTTDAVDVDGDVATDTGSMWIKVDLTGKQPVVGTGRYVIIWQRQNGAWKVHRFCDIMRQSSQAALSTE